MQGRGRSGCRQGSLKIARELLFFISYQHIMKCQNWPPLEHILASCKLSTGLVYVNFVNDRQYIHALSDAVNFISGQR